MGVSRFVRPDTAILKLSNGDTLTVKKRLTSGEQRAAYARMYLPAADGTLKVNPLATGLALIVAYLIDWSFTDDAGVIVPIRGLSMDELASVLDSLDHDSFTEIRDAIQAHDNAMDAERQALKNGKAGESGAAAISPSPSAVVGASSGFVN